LRERHGQDKLAGVGVGIPGFIQIQKGFIVGSNNLTVLENYPVRDDIEKRLGCKVILENDANAAALGEKWMGAGRDVDDLVLLTLGTGIGGGIISGGRILHGNEGMAAELGHITVSPNGNPCGCGNTGCVEKHASGLSGFGDGAADARSRPVGERCSRVGSGRKRSREGHLSLHMGTALGNALATLINIFNFPCIYLVVGYFLHGISSPRRCWRRSSGGRSHIVIRRRASSRARLAMRRDCTARPIYHSLPRSNKRSRSANESRTSA
jgi:glucokinase